MQFVNIFNALTTELISLALRSNFIILLSIKNIHRKNTFTDIFHFCKIKKIFLTEFSHFCLSFPSKWNFSLLFHLIKVPLVWREITSTAKLICIVFRQSNDQKVNNFDLVKGPYALSNFLSFFVNGEPFYRYKMKWYTWFNIRFIEFQTIQPLWKKGNSSVQWIRFD